RRPRSLCSSRAGDRYQFLLDAGGNSHIQKTVEGNGNVTYFVPAGTHDLYLDQDTATGADWSVTISLAAAGNDTMPYSKSGGDIGGSGNDFSEEWLPVALGAPATVNLSIETAGNTGDNLQLEVYESGSVTPDFTLSQVLGTEKLWANFPLSAGVNRLRLVADGGNSAATSYSLTLSSVPGGGTATWDGASLDTGLNSVIMVDFPSTGLYRFQLNATQGFANLVLDDALPLAGRSVALGTTYDIVVTAGLHEVFTIQDTNFPLTDWTASVAPVAAGSTFFTFNGAIAPGDTITPTYPLFGGSLNFNFSLTVGGSEPVDLTIRNGSGAVAWNGAALDGETLWGTAALTNGTNSATLTNNGGNPANVTLVFYSIPTAAYTWTGVADSAGLNSHVRVSFPTAGLYTFGLDANSGRYQFLLENDYIQKTAENNTSVTYFVPAGTHDLVLDQDTSLGANWQVAISAVGPPNNSLPYTRSGGDIGGAGNDFTEEWLPVNLASPTQLNLAVTLTGTAGDNLLLEVYDTASLQTLVLTSTVYAGETHWVTFNLPAGTSRLHLVAGGGNSDSLSYALALDDLPTTSYTWSGVADPAGLNSHARLVFPAGGLYTFNLNVAGGRYQFLLDQEYIQKTVEGNGSVTYFVPAGTHDLVLVQDSAAGAGWSVAISAAGPANDSLPYTKSGGDIGGTGNDFSEEWLPINLGVAVQANLQLTVTGGTADSLLLEVEEMSGPPVIITLDPVFGTESVWATLDLPAAGARLHLVADGGNANPLAYELAISALPSPPHTWSGVSLDTGINSTVRLDMPVSGTYHVEVYMPTGFTVLNVDSLALGQGAPRGGGIFYEFDVPLAPGLHTFTSVQDTSFAVTSWIVTTTLLLADAPDVLSTDPISASDQVNTPVTVFGLNFMPGATVELVDGSNVFPLTGVTYISSTELEAVVPAGLPVGIYDVVVTNPDTQSGVLVDGFEIFQPITGLVATNDSPTLLGGTTTLTATVATGSNVVYTWDFGDGEFGNGAVVTHVYDEPGIYLATVTATNDVSNVSTTTTVTIYLPYTYLPIVIRMP
ncbi:MAG: PKD domain-containing protein, partial [Chloroflexi bacterium]|nr:PKD domain-containing protein [Chloroflexota bacterium]